MSRRGDVLVSQVTKHMEGVTKTMSKIMKTMDLEKTDKTMQEFEKQFEQLDVLTSVCVCVCVCVCVRERERERERERGICARTISSPRSVCVCVRYSCTSSLHYADALCVSLFQTVESSMSDATTLSTPQDQVEALIRQVAAENDLHIEDQLADLNPAAGSLRAGASAEPASKEDALERR